jgi:hypothetical protein
MTRRWQAIRVELLRGRDVVCDPPPGRVLVCPPHTTFEQLGEAIDVALARWDLSHLRMFELSDGTSVVDDELAEEMVASPFGPVVPRTAPLTTRVSSLVEEGSTFSYVFDLGDAWTHRCRVVGRVDPEDALGIVPDRPLASWGWGSIPDQYGRRWEDDDGESDVPVTVDLDPDLSPHQPAPAPVDMRAVRRAVATGAPKELVAALTGVDLTPALQQVGAALLATWQRSARQARELLGPLLLSVQGRLELRGWRGDDVLAEDLLATLRGDDPPGRVVPVSLDEVGLALEGASDRDTCYVNRDTGDVVPAELGDPAFVGDVAVDLEDPVWVPVEVESSKGSDLRSFVETVPDGAARASLNAAIQRRGAFSRFRRAVEDLDLVDRWVVYRDDRRWGRVRAALAEHGIRTNAL